MERDADNCKIANEWDISTHTLTWSVTLIFTMSVSLMVFQLTRSRGA
nr:MAG TPA: hypothetical protein [Caudoviricetes sp.]